MTEEDELLLARVPEEDRARNGIPTQEVRIPRARGAEVAGAALADLVLPGGLRTSPLGGGWSRDVDLHLSRIPDLERLEQLGWLPLDPLLRQLGLSGGGRWAIVQDRRILGVADFHLGPPPDPVDALLARCRRRGEVRAREALEARALVRAGRRFPNDPVVGVLAQVEAWLGGDLLAPWHDDPVAPPVALPGRRSRPLRRWAGKVLRRRVSVAISGVDGAGKSSLAGSVQSQLELAGVPANVVWTRPGMRLGALDRLARTGKRVLRQDPRPGLARVAGGEAPSGLASRGGALGWTWSVLVTLAFLADTRGRYRQARGVVIWDRHVLDALATMDFAYGAGAGLALQRFLARRLLPPADVSVYLDVTAETAVARKPGDLFGEHAIRRQLEAYERRRNEVAALHVLDAALPPDELAARIIRLIVSVASPRSRRA
jgi:thymidylate kinase